MQTSYKSYSYEMTPELSAALFGGPNNASLLREPSRDGLLNYATLAARLGTSEGWVRRNARRTYTRDPIPSVRLGKNVRFDWAKVEQWLKRRMR
jgi:predicted DNA-binding transcriptional regulator AlpA